MEYAHDLKDLAYGIVGLGIMGGSLAKAIRRHVLAAPESRGKIFACDVADDVLSLAKDEGVVDSSFTVHNVDLMLAQSDVVFVCLYPHATLEFLCTHMASCKSNSIVTDISGVKSFLVENAASFLRSDVDVVFGHPMAGGAKESYAHSNDSYFTGRNYIIMPQTWNKQEHIDMLKNLIRAIGFTRIVETDCITHDDNIAFTSQLCHIIAAALVKSTADEKITEFGGGSFEDLTRIAMINAPLWAELFLANRANLLAHIDNFQKQLEIAKGYVAEGDVNALESYLHDVRTRRMGLA